MGTLPLNRSGDSATVDAARLNNRTDAAIVVAKARTKPVTASIYQLDSLVRRAPALQATADARAAKPSQEVSA